MLSSSLLPLFLLIGIVFVPSLIFFARKRSESFLQTGAFLTTAGFWISFALFALSGRQDLALAVPTFLFCLSSIIFLGLLMFSPPDEEDELNDEPEPPINWVELENRFRSDWREWKNKEKIGTF